MGKKLPHTPNSKITAALRQLWMRSRERAKALKWTGYRCYDCGIKQSTVKGKEVKLEVHHNPRIDWGGIRELIRERLLNVKQYPLCKSCHKERHDTVKRHTKIYMKYHGYAVAEEILCENCGLLAVDIHHIEAKGMGGNPSKDVIGNLIALCRSCHEKAHAGEISREDLFETIQM
jgi:hypothetical protein